MEADRIESERIARSRRAVESQSTGRGDQLGAYSPLRSQGVTMSANHRVRESSILQMQGTHGNRAVQRAVHAQSGATASILPVQRSPLSGTSDMEEELLLSEGGVCLPEESGDVPYSVGLPNDATELESFNNILRRGTGGSPNNSPAPDAGAPNPLSMEKRMRDLKVMYEIVSNILQTRSEISTTFVRNMRG